MSYGFSDHIHRYAVWTAARAVQRNFTTTKRIQTAIESSGLADFLSNPIVDQNAFDKWHIETAEQIIYQFGGEAECSYGRAAKIIGIYLKTAWVIRHPEDDIVSLVIHPPLDRILLQELAKGKSFPNLKELASKSWTQFDKTGYWDVVKIIRLSGAPFYWRLEKDWNLN